MHVTTVESRIQNMAAALRERKPAAGRPPPSSLEGRRSLQVVRKTRVPASEQMGAAVRKAGREPKPVLDRLVPAAEVSEEGIARARAEALRLPFVGLAAMTLDPEAMRLVPEELCRKHLCLPVQKEAGAEMQSWVLRPTLVVAMADPTNLQALQDLEFASGCAVKPVVATPSEIRDALERCSSPEEWLRKFLANVSSSEDVRVLGAETSEEAPATDVKVEAPAVKMVNLIIQHGIREGATDIHVEPGVNDVLVRTRHEGLLREFIKAPKWLHEPLVSRLKIIARLDISERRRPQDGRIRVSLEGREVDLRVATLPTHFGEKVVLRILDGSRQIPTLEALGAEPRHLAALKDAASQPQGMILVTGPTGSGKTTTLYAILNERRNPSVNIVTVEDPIEIQVPGINQVQVNPKAGVTFAACLRSILRQDPNIILVGEIRDLETAEIASHAAATGHLVMSTLHTNSTLATVARLLDLGLDPYVISSSLNLILAQRLVRRICGKCREEYTPPADVLARLRLHGRGFRFFHGRGCEACGQTGYSGRLAVHEVLRMTPQIRELIHRKAPEPELRKAAAAGGTSFLVEQAIEKVKQGITTAEEVLRVIQLDDEKETLLCPACRSHILGDFTACPNCLFALKTVCRSCGQELKPEWHACPYCRTQAGGTEPRPMIPGPVPATATLARAAGQPVPAAPVKRPRILVVDDDEMSRHLAVKALSGLEGSPEVLAASSGLEGLDLVDRLRPDLLILDVMMPGMNGLEVCQKLRSNLATAFIPILMLTASANEDSRTNGFLAGTDDYMGKPFSVPELHARVSRLLRRTYGL